MNKLPTERVLSVREKNLAEILDRLEAFERVALKNNRFPDIATVLRRAIQVIGWQRDENNELRLQNHRLGHALDAALHGVGKVW